MKTFMGVVGVFVLVVCLFGGIDNMQAGQHQEAFELFVIGTLVIRVFFKE